MVNGRSNFKSRPLLGGLFVLLFLTGSPDLASRTARTDPIDTSHYRIWCKVYVTEQGAAKTVEVLRVEPHTGSDATIGEAVRKAVLSWKFKPNTENGKPVAGYVTIPVEWN